jgi:rare lipoprotein A
MGIRRPKTIVLAARGTVAVATCLLLANCASSDKFASRVDPKYGVSSSPRVVGFGEAVPKGGGTYRIGKPYTVAGRVYVPEEDPNYRAEGMASWYGDDFHGRLTANGEVFDMTSLTAAHPTLPIPSYARVTNVRNGKSLIVRVNDRGPTTATGSSTSPTRPRNSLNSKRMASPRSVSNMSAGRPWRVPTTASCWQRSGPASPRRLRPRSGSLRPIRLCPKCRRPRAGIRGEVPMPEGRPY